MKDTGWAATYHSLRDHWLWKDKPFSKGQAWIDLILQANYKDVVEFIKGRPHKFEKGTVSRSQRKLAEDWGWSRTKVIRFLHDLEATGMIEKKTTDYTIIKLVNWDKFQNVQTKKKTSNDTIDDTTDDTTGDTLTNKDTNNYNKERGEKNPLPPVQPKKFVTGKYQNVYLTQEEAVKLQKEFPAEASDMIEQLSEYMEIQGKSYNNHYAVIAKWIREDRQNPKKNKEDEDAKQKSEHGTHWTDHFFEPK